MENWIPITESDLADYLSGPQIEHLQQSVLAAGQDNPLPAVISDIVREVRAAIASHPANRLSSSPTLLPTSLKRTAIHLAIEAACSRIPELVPTETQQQLARESRNTLSLVAQGKWHVSLPDETLSEPANSGGDLSILNRRTRISRSDTLRGL